MSIHSSTFEILVSSNCDGSVVTLSTLGRFVPFHFYCAYNLTEVARDRLLVRIPNAYSDLEVCQGSS